MIHAQVEGDRQADRRPQRITPTDPIPELEHVARVDPEAGDGRGVGRHGHEMPGDGRFVPGCGQEPRPGRARVGHGFLRREGLGGHQEQHGLGMDGLQGLDQVAAVNVRDEMDAEIGLAVRLQRLADHLGAEIRPTDADIDDIRDRLAGVPSPCARADGFAERLHFGQHTVDFRHDVLATFGQDGSVRAVAQRDVQNGPVLGRIDLPAAEHGRDLLLQVGLAREIEQQPHGVLRHPILGIVEQDVAQSQRQALEPLRVTGKEVTHVRIGRLSLVLLQRLPTR